MNTAVGTNASGYRNETKNYNRTMVSMVLPIAFQNLMTALVSASDAVMLGFLEQDALSAVSLAGQVTFVFNLCVTILIQSVTILAAQYWGKGDRTSVEKILALSLRYMSVVTLVFVIGTGFFPRQIMGLLTNVPALIERGGAYLRIAGFSYIPLGLSQMYLCIMKNSGRTAKSTAIASVAMILNVALNALLIFGLFRLPRMEIRGAAIATVTAMTVQFVWTMAEERKKDVLHIRFQWILKNDPVLKKDFNHYTLPIIGNYFFWGGGVTIFSAIIGHMGNDAVAAHSIVNIVRNTLSCVTRGVGTAGAILVGNELGRGRIDLAKIFAKKSTQIAAVIGGITCILILVFRPLIMDVVTVSQEAKYCLSDMLLICSYYMIAQSINNMVIGGIFCAGGKSKFGCICDCIVLWIIVIPAASVAAFILNFPVQIVYFILCLDECIKVPIVFWYYRKYTWAQNLTRKLA